MLTRRINISEILDYMWCPAFWASRWWARKQLISAREHAADVGKVTHAIWERVMLSFAANGQKVHPEALNQKWWENQLHMEMKRRWLEAGFDEDKDDLRKLTAISHRAAWWWGQRLPFDEVLAVEQLLEVQMTGVNLPVNGKALNIILFGKLDAVVRREHRIQSFQLKTYGGHHPGLKMKLVKRSLHESGYTILGRQEYGQAWMGTHLTMIRTLPLNKREGGQLVMRPNASMVIDQQLVIDSALEQRAFREIMRTSHQIIEWEEKLNKGIVQPFELPQHEHHCGGAYSNSECWFLEYCMRKAELDDRMLYVNGDPLEHYAEVD